MNDHRMKIVFLGLSLSSSWGNGHATTFRALTRGLARRGHEIVFLERDVPWYAANRDLPEPDFCRLVLYDDLEDLQRRHRGTVASADAVVVGSYVPDGPAVVRWVQETARGVTGFYDIDTPVTLAGLRRGDCAYLERSQIPGLDVYFSFSGGVALTCLREEFGAVMPLALYCMVDEERYSPGGAEPRWDLGYLGTYSSDRQPALERLLIEPARALPDRRFVVAGPQYPDDIDWPANVERIEHVAPDDHPAFYGSLRFALNITRADMLATGHSPSVRLFEAAACGTPVITDRWDGLDDFFPEGDAILVASEAKEVTAALTLFDDADRRRLAARARAIALGFHTGRHRAIQFEHGIALARSRRRLPINPPERKRQHVRATA